MNSLGTLILTEVPTHPTAPPLPGCVATNFFTKVRKILDPPLTTILIEYNTTMHRQDIKSNIFLNDASCIFKTRMSYFQVISFQLIRPISIDLFGCRKRAQIDKSKFVV